MGLRLRHLVRTGAVALTAAPIGLLGFGLAVTTVPASAGAQPACPAPTTTSTTVHLLGGLLPPVTVPPGTPAPCPSPSPAPTAAPAPAPAPAPPPDGSSTNAASSPAPAADAGPPPAAVAPAPTGSSPDASSNFLAAPPDPVPAPVDLGTPLAPPATVGGDQTVTTDAVPAGALPARPPLVGARTAHAHGLGSLAGPEVLAAILIAAVGAGLFAWTRRHQAWPGHRSARPAAGSGA